jgi:ABC-type branched-subunit amino acid transport system permease subunit
MLATAALFVTAGLGLTIQFGYAGIANFAGAAFFGIGCYTL